MLYKGYSAIVGFDDEGEVFFGRLAGIRDGISFEADNVTDLKAAFHEAVDDYLETCGKIGKAPETPCNFIKVQAIWDDEAEVWSATSYDIAGLAIESASFEGLKPKVIAALADLIELNGTNSDSKDVAALIKAEWLGKVLKPSQE